MEDSKYLRKDTDEEKEHLVNASGDGAEGKELLKKMKEIGVLIENVISFLSSN